MGTEDLIKKLSKEHDKITPVESIAKQFLKWIVICFLCLLAGISSLGLREDWSVLFTEPLLLLQNILLFLSFISIGLVSLVLARPGELSVGQSKKVFLVSIVFWIFVLGLMAMNGDISLERGLKMTYGCITDILVIGFLPGLTLFFLIRKGIVLHRYVSGLLSCSAFLLLGAWATQFTCHNDDPLHILLWHFLPILVLASLGAWIFLKISKKI